MLSVVKSFGGLSKKVEKPSPIIERNYEYCV